MSVIEASLGQPATVLCEVATFEPGIKLRWEWYRDGFVYRSVESHVRPFGTVEASADADDWDIRLLDDQTVCLRVSDMEEEGYRFWRMSDAPSAQHDGGDRRGRRDEDNGKEGSKASTSDHAASQRIELLEDLLMEMVRAHTVLLGDVLPVLGSAVAETHLDRLRSSLAAFGWSDQKINSHLAPLEASARS